MTNCSAPRSSTPPVAFSEPALMLLLEVVQGEAEGRQSQRIGLDVDLAQQPAVADHVGHAVDPEELGRTTQSCSVRSVIGSPPAPSSV